MACCTYCGEELSKDAKFCCDSCGRPLPRLYKRKQLELPISRKVL